MQCTPFQDPNPVSNSRPCLIRLDQQNEKSYEQSQMWRLVPNIMFIVGVCVLRLTDVGDISIDSLGISGEEIVQKYLSVSVYVPRAIYHGLPTPLDQCACWWYRMCWKKAIRSRGRSLKRRPPSYVFSLLEIGRCNLRNFRCLTNVYLMRQVEWLEGEGSSHGSKGGNEES